MFVLSLPISAQQNETHDRTSEFKRHHLSVLGGVAFIPAGEKLEMAAAAIGSSVPGSTVIVAPVIGLEYEYSFNRKWSLAFMTDLELQSYQIRVGDMPVLRENVWIISLVTMYKITHGLVIYAGPGYEIEHNHNFWVLRTGTKYEFELGKHWDLSPYFEFDWKEEYVSHSIGVTLGKKF